MARTVSAVRLISALILVKLTVSVEGAAALPRLEDAPSQGSPFETGAVTTFVAPARRRATRHAERTDAPARNTRSESG